MGRECIVLSFSSSLVFSLSWPKTKKMTWNCSPVSLLKLFVIFSSLINVFAKQNTPNKLPSGKTIQFSIATRMENVTTKTKAICESKCRDMDVCWAFTFDRANRLCSLTTPDTVKLVKIIADPVKTRQSYIMAKDFDECKPNPCRNGGFCKDKLFGFKCSCSEDRFHGKKCENVVFKWIPSSNQGCSAVCGRDALHPVSLKSYLFRNKRVLMPPPEPNQVCAADSGDKQGYQPGYTSRYYVGCILNGSRMEIVKKNTTCLCTAQDPYSLSLHDLAWFNDDLKQSCVSVCSSHSGWAAVWSDQSQLYHVCTCKSAVEGFFGMPVPGFEKKNYLNNACTVKGKKCEDRKKCLCYKKKA